MIQHRVFIKSMVSGIWKGLSEVLTILLKQIILKENTYGSILCLLAQLNMFRGSSLQPTEWILFYPYVNYTAKKTAKLRFLFINFFFAFTNGTHKKIYGFSYSSNRFRV